MDWLILCIGTFLCTGSPAFFIATIDGLVNFRLEPWDCIIKPLCVGVGMASAGIAFLYIFTTMQCQI